MDVQSIVFRLLRIYKFGHNHNAIGATKNSGEKSANVAAHSTITGECNKYHLDYKYSIGRYSDMFEMDIECS